MSDIDIIYAPSDLVVYINQTLDYAYPSVIVEGEMSSFRVSKNRWVYFDIKDEFASVRCFGTVHSLPGPLEDGIRVRIVAQPRLHPQFGFSLNYSSVELVGEGSIKRAQDLLFKKLEAEGLFDPARKRLLPEIPKRIGLITSDGSAAYHDFIKILGERWGGVEILFVDSQVQGATAPEMISEAIEKLNSYHEILDVLVVTRGGGSVDDLAAFSTEKVARAVAMSRIPTLVAIGHEVDTSIAELTADVRASTPTNAAQLLVPDRAEKLREVSQVGARLKDIIVRNVQLYKDELTSQTKQLDENIASLISRHIEDVLSKKRLLEQFNPSTVLKRGYALVRNEAGAVVSTAAQARKEKQIITEFKDGTVVMRVLD